MHEILLIFLYSVLGYELWAILFISDCWAFAKRTGFRACEDFVLEATKLWDRPIQMRYMSLCCCFGDRAEDHTKSIIFFPTHITLHWSARKHKQATPILQ